MDTRVSHGAREVIIGPGRPTVLIGERINPAGKPKLAEALKTGNLEVVRQEALAQAKAGADILDIHVSTFGVDEVDLLPRVVRAVTEVVDLPLCLDSANPRALEAALKVYQGRPLINSVTGEALSLARVLPLVKEYGTAVIGLVQDDDGIPKDNQRRAAIARKIVERAEAAGIPRESIVIDCLALPVGADMNAGQAAIGAISQVSAELGVNTTLGVSNVSFGLPERSLLSGAFAVMAVAAGATSLIVDVARVRATLLAAEVILGRDRRARRYIQAFRQQRGPQESNR